MSENNESKINSRRVLRGVDFNGAISTPQNQDGLPAEARLGNFERNGSEIGLVGRWGGQGGWI